MKIVKYQVGPAKVSSGSRVYNQTPGKPRM